MAVGAAVLSLAVTGVFSPSFAGGSGLKPKAGSYSGHAGPDRISFTISPSRDEVIRLTTDFQSCGIITIRIKTHFPTLTIRKGSFRGNAARRPHPEEVVKYSIKGHFASPKEATGVVHQTLISPKKAGYPPCHRSATFSAKLR